MSTTPTIVTCRCGAKVRLSTGPASRALRCPKCKATLQLAAEPVVVATQPLEIGSGPICPICQTSIAAEEPVTTCPDCEQSHHRDCWAEIGGCSTYGCAQAPALDKSDESVAAPLSAWGDTKKCPACGETIKAIAMRCRYCGTDFDSVDPLTVADLRRQAKVSGELGQTRQWAIALFILSVLGFLAPIMLPAGLAFALTKRKQLAQAGPLFVIMGWAAVVLSTIYCLLMLIFVLVEA